MSQPTEQIPSDLLAAAVEKMVRSEFTQPMANLVLQTANATLERIKLTAEAALEAAGVPELLRDAERYRWLRSQHWSDAPLVVVREPRVTVKLGYDLPSLERLDEAIDEAMAKPEGGRG